ncbi:hypothetical protein V8F20_001989 [Naviculisporaceae sp. PSN 640]
MDKQTGASFRIGYHLLFYSFIPPHGIVHGDIWSFFIWKMGASSPHLLKFLSAFYFPFLELYQLLAVIYCNR